MQILHIPPASIKITYPSNCVKNEECIGKSKVSCSGSDSSSTHPKVYISLKNGSGTCPYCGMIFKK